MVNSIQYTVQDGTLAAACILPLYDLFVGPTEVVVTVDLPYVDQKRVKLRCPTEDIMEVYRGNEQKDYVQGPRRQA